MKKYLIISIFILNITSFALKKEFSYYGLKLGLSFDETLAIIETNQIFKIDESRFFGKINEPVPFIIKATYHPYISQIYIQFCSNIAYGITIQFNHLYFDYFSLSEKLEDSYGTPVKKTSKITEWRNLSNFQNIFGNTSDIILRLEYPSTVKVFDNNILLRLNSEVRENIIKATNLSTINSNRKALLNEL